MRTLKNNTRLTDFKDCKKCVINQNKATRQLTKVYKKTSQDRERLLAYFT